MTDYTEKEWRLIESAVKQLRFTTGEYYELYEKIKRQE